MIPNKLAYSKALMIKTGWHLSNNRQIDQWYILQSPKIKPYKYGQLIF